MLRARDRLHIKYFFVFISSYTVSPIILVKPQNLGQLIFIVDLQRLVSLPNHQFACSLLLLQFIREFLQLNHVLVQTLGLEAIQVFLISDFLDVLPEKTRDKVAKTFTKPAPETDIVLDDFEPLVLSFFELLHVNIDKFLA